MFIEKVLAELSSAVWRGPGWPVVSHLLQLQTGDTGAGADNCRYCVDIIYMLYLPSHNQWWPHPGAGGGVATVATVSQPLRTATARLLTRAPHHH